MKEGKFLTPERTLDASREAQNEGSRRDSHSFRYESTGANQAFAANHAAVEEDRPHPNEAKIIHPRPMHDRAMADRDPFTQDDGDLA